MILGLHICVLRDAIIETVAGKLVSGQILHAISDWGLWAVKRGIVNTRSGEQGSIRPR